MRRRKIFEGVGRKVTEDKVYDTNLGGSRVTYKEKRKMAMGEEHTSCWIHKEAKVQKEKVETLHRAARASGGKLLKTNAKCGCGVLSKITGWGPRSAG